MTKIVLPHLWTPRDYQMPVWRHMQQPTKEGEQGQRAISIWHRRAGKDLTAINFCATASQKRVGLYLHLLPFYKQGRKIVWNGMDRKGRKFLDAFPQELIESKNDAEMTIKLKNGSIYQVAGTDNIDSLVGTNPVGLILSEYSLQDPHAYDYLRPILAENGGWAWFIYTPRGRNHGYDLFNNAKKMKNWYAEVLTVDDTKAINMEAIEEDRAMGMDEATIRQEYYCSFDATFKGAYYGKQMVQALEQGRIRLIPYEPLLPVNTCWDLGMDDSTAIWFYQEMGREVRIIDYYENSGEGIRHYINELSKREYTYGTHYAPWDIEVKELGTGVSRWETAKNLGIRFKVVPRLSIEDGIEAVRNLLPRCWFNYAPELGEERLKYGIEALRQYQKEYDERKKVFKSKPLHDWCSHAADAFRYLASVTTKEKKKIAVQRKAISEYDII